MSSSSPALARVVLPTSGSQTPGLSPFWKSQRQKAAARPVRLLFPEAEDPRVLSAVHFLVREKLARPILVGEPDRISAAAGGFGFSLEGIEVRSSLDPERRRILAQNFLEKRRAKGLTEEDAKKLSEDPLYFAVAALKDGQAEGLVGGAVRTTADTVRAGFSILGMSTNAEMAFGAFWMECPHAVGGPRPLLFADSAVSPHPSARSLASVSMAAARYFESVTGETPRVALLSFSTLGSAEDETILTLRQALALIQKKAPGLNVAGELQGDAALVDHIALQKGATDLSVAGRANILIFPDLNAGNIAYKLVQHLGGARAVGPLVMGLSKPMTDLSRGCNDEDIVDAAVMVSQLGEK